MKSLYPLLLCFLIYFQSCVVYQKTPVSIGQAVDQGNVKVVMNKGSIYEFHSIFFKDSTYYGAYVKEAIGSSGEILDPRLIEAIYLKDDERSKNGNMAIKVSVITLSIPLLILLGIYILALSMGG